MINNEKVEKIITAFKVWKKRKRYTKSEMEILEKTGYTDSVSYYAGYADRNKEAEEEKRELIEALVFEYKCAKAMPQQTNKMRTLRNIIEKHTGKPIEEVIK